MIYRAFTGLLGALIIFSAFSYAAAPGIAGAFGGAIVMLAIVRWNRPRKNSPNYDAVVRAAIKLAHAFALTDNPCIEETRELSRAVFLGDAK